MYNESERYSQLLTKITNKMRNLLEIETGLLSSDAVKTGLQLSRVKSLQKSIKTAQRTKFRKQLELADAMRTAKEWFDLPTTQSLFAENGVTWTAEDLADKVFECQKPWMYKCIKASGWDDEVVGMFEYQCKALQDQGKSVKMGLEDLNKFASAYLEDENTTVADVQKLNEESVVEDTIAEDSGAEDSVVEDTTSDTVVTFSFTLQGRNVAVRYSLSEGLVTTNSKEDILDAIAFLTEQLNDN